MAFTLTITDHWEDGKRFHFVGTLVPSGSYVTGGDTIPFNNPLIKSGSAPVYVSAQANVGYDLVGLPGVAGSTPPNAKLQIFTSSTGSELSAGAYPGALTGALIQVYAIFPKHI